MGLPKSEKSVNCAIFAIALAFYISVTSVLYLLTLNSAIDWTYNFDLQLHSSLVFTISTLCFFVQSLLITSIINSKKIKDNLKINLIFIAVHIIIRLLLGTGFVLNTMLPLLLALIVAKQAKEWGWLAKTLLIVLGYQLLAGFVFIGITPHYGYVDTNVGNELLFAFNFNLFLLLIYFLRRCSHDLVLYSVPRSDVQSSRRISEEIRRLMSMSPKQRIVMFSLLILSQLFQWVLLLFVSWTFGLFLFTFINSMAFLIIGVVADYKVHWELSSTLRTYIACTLTTALMFLAFARLMPDIRYSLVITIYSAIILTIILNKLGQLQSYIKSVKQPFMLVTATEEQIRKKCLGLNKSENYINFTIDAFVNKMSDNELCGKYFYTDRTVKEYKRLRRRELEN